MASECRLGTSLVSVAKDCLAWRKSGRQEEKNVTRGDLSCRCLTPLTTMARESRILLPHQRATSSVVQATCLYCRSHPGSPGSHHQVPLRAKVGPSCWGRGESWYTLITSSFQAKTLGVHVMYVVCVCPCVRTHRLQVNMKVLFLRSHPPWLSLETLANETKAELKSTGLNASTLSTEPVPVSAGILMGWRKWRRGVLG